MTPSRPHSNRKLTFATALLTPLLLSTAPLLSKPKKGTAPIANVTIPHDSLTILYGNSLLETLQEEGSFEAYLQASSQGKKDQYRSMAYPGDQINYRIRAERFGQHMSYLIKQWPADRIIMAFGSNEAYAGAPGIETFKTQLTSYLQLIKNRHPKSRYVLASPIASENVSNITGLDLNQRNQDLQLYTQAMAQIAKEQQVTFIDLFTPTAKLFKNSDKTYTDNSMNLNEKGAQSVGKIFANLLNPKGNISQIDPTTPGFRTLRTLVSTKANDIIQAYHPANGVHYYGVRARSYEYNAEIPHYLKLANTLDQAIWKQAQQLTTALPIPKREILHAKVPSKKARMGFGEIKTSQEDLKDFTIHQDFEISCFASSEEFPELINPLQMQFDSKGRLWVCCFASYPHALPGATPNDTLLIFEDTNGDGKADKKTTFAEGLNLPDGFVFYKDGVLVSLNRKIAYLADTDGDDKADHRENILRGIDNTDTHHSGYLSKSPQGHLIFSEALFHRGQFETLNGVVHTKDSCTLSYDMDTRTATVERQTEMPNPWKTTYNQWGESIQYFGGGQVADADIHNISTPMGNTAPTAIGEPFRYDKGCAAQFVNSPHFPKEWQGGILTGHLLRTNEINFTPLTYTDGAFKSAADKTILLSSQNRSFRPTDLTFGLDGALYVSDFYYPIIGHAQHSTRDEKRDYANGRIWKITHKKSPLTKAPQIAGATTTQLIELLKSPFLKIRQTARLELEKHTTADILQSLDTVKADFATNELFALEALWLHERLKDVSDTTLIKQLLSSSDLHIQRAAVSSLRWWAPLLNKEDPTLISKLAQHPDERLKILLIGALSYLPEAGATYSALVSTITVTNDTPLAYAQEMFSWHNRPSIASEIPLLQISPQATISPKQWLKGKQPLSGHLYLRSDRKRELILGHHNNAFLHLTVNDTPVLIPSGSVHAKSSQNNIPINNGLNKIEYLIINPVGAKRTSNTAKINLSDKTGNVAQGISFAQTLDDHQLWADQYEKEQSSNWKEFALKTFQTNCANCHAIETSAVGPALKGLFGKKQNITRADGTKETITVDHHYIKESLVNPTATYPEGYQPIMPKMPLTEKEVNALTRWIESLN